MNEINIVALELGSSKIKGAVGTVDSSGAVTVKVVEEEPLLDWVRYGIVSNVEEVAVLTANLLERLEKKISPLTVDGVYVAMGGRSFRSDNRETERLLPEETEISSEIIEQLMGETQTTVPASRELFSIEAREYVVDKSRVSKPIGTFGRSIRMYSNVITCRPQIKRNLKRLLNEKLGLNINGFVVRQTAQADFVLNPEEKRLGCMLVDFGAETTSVSIYKNDHLQYFNTIPLGSRNITRDLTNLNYIEEQAEEIKQRMGDALGSANLDSADANSGINIVAVNNYISNRAGEIIANIREQIKYAELRATDIPAGIVLVGRGARLRGFGERLAKVTGLKVRTGNSACLDIRLADPRISMSDSVDVISTLYYAARHTPLECLTKFISEPEPEQEVQQTVVTSPEPEKPVEVTPVSEVSTDTPESPKTPKQRKSWMNMSKWKERFNKIMDESEEMDDDDAIMREDED